MTDTADASTGLRIGVPRERAQGERRVALTPEGVGKLATSGVRVIVETNAGASAAFPDAAYREAGGTVVPDVATLYEEANVVMKIGVPSPEEMDLLKAGMVLI